jgi:GNAT superfamily N-acetyltransferase
VELPDPVRLAEIVEFAEVRAMTDYFRAAPDWMVEQFGLHTEQVGNATLLMVPGLDDPFYNRVVGLGISETASQDQMDEIIERYRSNGVENFWIQIGPTAQPDYLWEWLEQRGFFANGSWVKAIRDTSTPPFVDTGMELQVIDSEWADAFAAVGVEAYGLPEIIFPMLAATVGRPEWKHYLAFDGDFPAAAAAMHIGNDAAWLGFMGTRPSHQRRGAQTALITRRIYDASLAGCRWVVSDTVEHDPEKPNRSLLNLERMGFHTAYWRVNFMRYWPE